MSTYTTQLRYICEEYAKQNKSVDYASIPAVIAAARPKVFDFDFPMFDASYRNILETKIIYHFYFREIGAETAAQFKFMLCRTLNEIMPYYNKMYETLAMTYDIFNDVNYTRTGYRKDENKKKTEHGGTDNTRRDDNLTTTRTDDLTMTSTPEATTTTTTTDEHKNDTWQMVSDTPQGGLSGARSEEYLSNVTHTTDEAAQGSKMTAEVTHDGSDTITNTGDVTTENTGYQTVENKYGHTIDDSGDSTSDYWETITGKMGSQSYASLIKEYRENILNIDMMIINDLEICFMGIY